MIYEMILCTSCLSYKATRQAGMFSHFAEPQAVTHLLAAAVIGVENCVKATKVTAKAAKAKNLIFPPSLLTPMARAFVLARVGD